MERSIWYQQIDQALEAYREAEQILRPLSVQNPRVHKYRQRLSAVLSNKAGAHYAVLQLAEAVAVADEASQIAAKLAAEFPEPDYQHDHAMALFLQATLQVKTTPARAREKLLQAEQILKPLVEEAPHYRKSLKMVMDWLQRLKEQGATSDL